MFIKQRKATTDPRVRSLLQKATRRGFPIVVETAVRRLAQSGDRSWLRSRAVVITFEECWPLGAALSLSKDDSSKLRMLLDVCRSVKQKDAAGLGALAWAYHEGNRSMLDIIPDERSLRIVAEAVRRPHPFFEWARSESSSERQSKVVDAAQRYLAAATWGWDKACLLAGAYLATTGDVPQTTYGKVSIDEFPLWVALDKHTPQGKPVLREVAGKLRLSYRQMIWASFYFESALVNELASSVWWESERLWRLRRAGLSVNAGSELWLQAKDLVRAGLDADESSFRDALDDVSAPQQNLL